MRTLRKGSWWVRGTVDRCDAKRAQRSPGSRARVTVTVRPDVVVNAGPPVDQSCQCDSETPVPRRAFLARGNRRSVRQFRPLSRQSEPYWHQDPPRRTLAGVLKDVSR